MEHEIFGDGREFTIHLHHKKDAEFRVISVLQRDGKPLPSWVKFNADGKSFSGRLPNNITSLDLDVGITDTSGRSKLPITLSIDGYARGIAKDGGQSVIKLGREWRGGAIKSDSPSGLAPFSRQLRAALMSGSKRTLH